MTTLRAPAPKRASASVTLSLALVTIPCQLFSATENGGIKRSEYVRNGDGSYHKIKQQKLNGTTGDVVPYENVVKLFETEKGPVELSDDEIDGIIQAAPGKADIVAFLPLAILMSGHYLVEKIYQVRPASRSIGKRKEADGPATILLDALLTCLRKQGKLALILFTMRSGSSPRYAALLPNARLYTLMFDDEVREDLPITRDVAPANIIEAMGELVRKTSETEPLPLVDKATEAVVAYALKKLDGTHPTVVAPKVSEESPDDLMAALEAALRDR